MHIQVRPAPIVVDQTFRFYHAHNDFLKKRILVDCAAAEPGGMCVYVCMHKNLGWLCRSPARGGMYVYVTMHLRTLMYCAAAELGYMSV